MIGIQTARLLYNFPYPFSTQLKDTSCANPSASGYGPPPQWPFFYLPNFKKSSTDILKIADN